MQNVAPRYEPQAIIIDYCTLLIIKFNRAVLRTGVRRQSTAHACDDNIAKRYNSWMRIMSRLGKRWTDNKDIGNSPTGSGQWSLEPSMAREEVFITTTRLRITRSSTYSVVSLHFPRLLSLSDFTEPNINDVSRLRSFSILKERFMKHLFGMNNCDRSKKELILDSSLNRLRHYNHCQY